MIFFPRYLEKSLIEDLPVLLPVLPQDDLAEVWVVDETIHIDLIGHVYHLLFSWVQTKSFHGIQGVLGESKFGLDGKFVN